MKRKSIYCAAAIAAALAIGAMTGCGGQSASQASASSASASSAVSASASASQTASASASASQAAEKSQDEIIAELKESLSKVPAYKSVTVTEKALSWINNDAEAAQESSSAFATALNDTLETTTVYKFDESGDKPKTSSVAEMADIKLSYYTDGDDAVCVTDGPVYSGKIEQFDSTYKTSADEYLKSAIGDLNVLVDCIESVTQDEINGVTGYELILDPKKYVESDEILQLMSEGGDSIQEAYVTVGFDKDGRIVWMTRTNVFSEITSSLLLDLTDYDSTVIDPMPEATATYEDMMADMQTKFNELDNELDEASELDGETNSTDAPEVK